MKSIDIPLLMLIKVINNIDSNSLDHSADLHFRGEPENPQSESESDFAKYEDEFGQSWGINPKKPSMADFANILKVSKSSIHDSITRMTDVQLIVPTNAFMSGYEVSTDFGLLVKYGIKYIFPAQIGTVTRGIVTATAREGISSATDLPFVWPTPLGNTRGISLSPIHKSIPILVNRFGLNSFAYDIASAMDSLRVGSYRDKEMAVKILDQYL